MSIVGLLLVPILLIGLIAFFVLMTVEAGRFIPPIAQYGALSSLVLTAIVTTVGVIAVLIGNQVSVDLGIAPSMPSLDVPGMRVVEPEATIVSAESLTATYSVTGLSLKVRAAYALSILINGVIVAYFSWIIYAVAKGLRSGTPFTGRSTQLIRAGALLFTGSLLSQISKMVGNLIASNEALMITDWSYEGSDPEVNALIDAGHQPFPDWPFPSETLGEISLTPLGIAVALVLLGVVFSSGERFQRDSEGLV